MKTSHVVVLILLALGSAVAATWLLGDDPAVAPPPGPAAPHSATTAPASHSPKNSGRDAVALATSGGVRKMPMPSIEPATMAMAPMDPTRRGCVCTGPR